MVVALFQITSFLSAFLLFAIQPIMAKALLPALGGSAVVWGTCMVSFQALLFLGYLVSHGVLSRWRLRHYVWIHVALLLLAAIMMGTFGVVTTSFTGPPWIMVLIAALTHVGLPFFLLSFSTPLLQRWLSEIQTAAPVDPYRLFSTSNAGSLLALLAYPFLIEPRWALSHQTSVWRMGIGLMVILIVTLRITSRWHTKPIVSEAKAVRFSGFMRVFALSASGTALLLAVTNAITFDISSAPLLWVLPLALYLASFIVVFKRHPWLSQRVEELGKPWWVALGLTFFLMGRYHVGIDGPASVLCHLVVLGFGCWLAHARMAQLKPSDERALTSYYVAMSAGGLFGSVVVSWVVPVIANSFVEYPLAIAAMLAALHFQRVQASQAISCSLGALVSAGIMVVFVLVIRSFESPILGFAGVAGILMILSLARRDTPWLVGIALAVWLSSGATKDILWNAGESEHYRNHYGIYEVSESAHRRSLTHGTTNHGIQNVSPLDPSIPLSYYHRGGPAGSLLEALEPRTRHFGMIGLGAGALVAYTHAGDVFEVYELDPLNIQLAATKFTYLSDREAIGVDVRVHEGDGRLLLKGVSARFDVLILDAFSSGSIPMHLLTTEALETYLRAVKPDGFVLMHISNRALHLRPLIASTMLSLDGIAYFKDSDSPEDSALKSSDWALLAPSAIVARTLADEHGWFAWEETEALPRPWTDETSDLLSVWR